MSAPTILDDQDAQIPAINAALLALAHLFTLTVDYVRTTGLTLYLRGGHIAGTTTTVAEMAAGSGLTMPASATFYVDADPTTFALAIQTGAYTGGRTKIGYGTTNTEGLLTWNQDFVAGT